MRARVMIIVAVVFALLGAVFAIAVPNTPTEGTIIDSGRRNYTVDGGLAVGAQAGNVTQLDIQSNTTTTHWQGYYGSVSGEITLDDAGNSTLFNWVLTTPTGEVYASNTSTVTWANITCVNLTGDNEATTLSRSKLNNSILEAFFNITGTDSDGVDETFDQEYAGSFDVGSTTIDGTYLCPMAYMNVNNDSQSSSFQEVVLTDNVSSIWTAILEDDETGFDGSAMDFQMIVPENQAEGVTNYYFFVELS
ncbi:hypothetical protein JXB11_00245 [Candidatus Woesearchaeota archaeon]|nr:hypothetical protein [Candidatus Woesearchaeota archaeon]